MPLTSPRILETLLKKKVKKKTENNPQCYLFNNMKKQKTITRDDRIASKSHDVKTTDPL